MKNEDMSEGEVVENILDKDTLTKKDAEEICESVKCDRADKRNDLKKAHYELMVEYVNIINQVSKLPSLFKVDLYPEIDKSLKQFAFLKILKQFDLGNLRPTTSGFLVKLFVESHIKGKLNQLRRSYVQFAQTIDEPSDSNYQKWLKQAEEGTKKFTNTLSS